MHKTRKYAPYHHKEFKTKTSAVNFRKKVRKTGNSTHLYKKSNGLWKVYIYY